MNKRVIDILVLCFIGSMWLTFFGPVEWWKAMFVGGSNAWIWSRVVWDREAK